MYANWRHLKFTIVNSNNKFNQNFLEKFLTLYCLNSENSHTRFQNLTANHLDSDNKSWMCKMSSSHPNFTWVKNFEPFTLSAKKAKNRVKLGPKLRCSNILVVECLYGDKRLWKHEVQSIFAILVRNVFITQSKVYDEAFLQKKSKAFSR